MLHSLHSTSDSTYTYVHTLNRNFEKDFSAYGKEDIPKFSTIDVLQQTLSKLYKNLLLYEMQFLEDSFRVSAIRVNDVKL